jgi:hypothetical protein
MSNREIVMNVLNKMGVKNTTKMSRSRAMSRLSRLFKDGTPDDVEFTDEEEEFLKKECSIILDAGEGDQPSDSEKKDKPAKNKKKATKDKPAKKRSTELIGLLTQLLQTPHTRNELVELVKEEMNDVPESTIRTYLSDSKNSKYNKFPSLVQEDGKKRLYLD